MDDKIHCQCGGVYDRKYKWQHFSTKQHKEYVKSHQTSLEHKPNNSMFIMSNVKKELSKDKECDEKIDHILDFDEQILTNMKNQNINSEKKYHAYQEAVKGELEQMGYDKDHKISLEMWRYIRKKSHFELARTLDKLNLVDFKK